MSKVTTVTTGLDVMAELADEIPAGPHPAEEVEALRRSAMHLTCIVLRRFPEIR